MEDCDKAQIVQRIKKIFAEQLGLEESKIQATSSIEKDLGADSLDMLELVMALEDEFGHEIDDDVAEKFSIVQDAIDHVIDAESAT